MGMRTRTEQLATTSDFMARMFAQVAPEGKIGPKVLTHYLWAAYVLHGNYAGNLKDFKGLLIRTHLRGKVTLTRCDMVSMFPASDVSMSEIQHLGATFNFVSL